MKINITLNYSWEYDDENPKDKWLFDTINDYFRDIDPGVPKDSDDIHDAVREIIADDISVQLDDISEMDFEIKVDPKMTIKTEEATTDDE